MPLFFGGFGLSLEDGLDGLSGQFSCGRDGEGFDLGEDLSIGCVAGSLLQLFGEQECLFENEGL
jgi:hypothetical protein